jgi:hypothetical protein
MKVFVGWPYEVSWIETHAIPLVKTYGVEVITGKELHGQKLTDGVKDDIEKSDGAVFFTTKRTQNSSGGWTTSDWVVDEIKHANSIKLSRILEIREEGVEYPNKIHDERQYIVMKPEERMDALLELGKAVSNWRGLTFKLKLLPEELIKAVRPRIANKKYQCNYSIRQQGKIIHGPTAAEIQKEDVGLFIYAHDLPANILGLAHAFVEVNVDIGDQWWGSGIPLGSVDVNLDKV